MVNSAKSGRIVRFEINERASWTSIQHVRLSYFDMPPILAVTDAQIMANVCDASVLVVRSESTEKETAVKAKGLLESAKGKLLGVVLNDREREEGLYYYYGAN